MVAADAESDDTGRQEYVVRPEEDHERLDRVVSARDPSRSRATIQRWIDAGHVTLDGAPTRRGVRVRAGQRVRVQPVPPPPSAAVPQDIPLSVLYEDAHLLVIDKPPGLVVHPAPGHPDGTLVNAVLHHRPPPGDPMRPGIVHRLDKDTSGVMVVAMSEVAREGLVARFAAHDLERVYEALALGSPPDQATYEAPIARHPHDRKRFTSRTDRGKRAVTHVRTLERLRGAARVECKLETGRTHQIRVHLADHGHPLLGDPVYGRRSRDPGLRDVADVLGRQALHARLLAFSHPVTGEALRFETDPPSDYERALSALRRSPAR